MRARSAHAARTGTGLAALAPNPATGFRTPLAGKPAAAAVTQEKLLQSQPTLNRAPGTVSKRGDL